MKCSKCGAEGVAGAAFCHQCGGAIGDPAAKSAGKPAAGGLIRGGDKDDPEEILWQGTYSKLGMIGGWLVAAAITLVVLAAGLLGAVDGKQWLGVLGLLALMWIGLVLRLLYVQLSTHYYLTNQRFIHERGLLWRTIDRVETIDVDDVVCQQGPVERMLGVGTIRVKTSDQSSPELTLTGIEDVRRVASILDDARRKERRKRGMYVESV
jgi:membrane protein YdbS with pleckstrin-like domain